MSNSEIDLSDPIEGQFDKPSAVARVIGCPDLEFKVVQLGIEKSLELRIRHEDINVMAFTMADLQHHGGAAAE